MATLLDEILQETNATGAEARCPSTTHSAGCKCIECSMKKIQPSAKHKSWRERRDERLTKKDSQIQRVQKNRSSGINSSLLSEILLETGSPAVSSPPRQTPLVKSNMVSIAVREWNRWSRGTIKEDAPGMRGILRDYWNNTPGGGNILSKSSWWNSYPWSAAFICYVVRNAGAGSAFHYSSYHTTYTFYAKQNRINGSPNTFKAYRVTERRPQLGDIIIQNYDSSGRNYDNVRANEGGAHGDIVVEVLADHIKVIGGNVGNSVTRRQYPVNSTGFLSSVKHWAIVAIDNGTSSSPYLSRTMATGAAGAVSGVGAGVCQIPVQIPANINTALSVRMSKKDKSGKRHVLGYAGSGGGRLTNILSAINQCGKLTISPDEIDMFQRISNVETGGLIQAINSWDSAYMSMGFMQLTAKYGELQKLIQRAPVAFNRYGIALDTQKYSFGELKIRGTSYANELRNRDWAERFFRAGLDTDIIVAEVIHGRAIIQSLLASISKWLGKNFQYFNNFYNSSSILRALVQETHNNRPAYLRSALQSAVRDAKARNISQILPFLTLLRDKIRNSYKANAARENDTPQHMLLKAEHIISRTANL